ncbi:hypothetical protein [Pseudomonas akapageensis]|uniref:hypothetical protein n=1 Tax=Pseudomonas akapageensis TaxID=2609961 RepID=UPI00140955F0
MEQRNSRFLALSLTLMLSLLYLGAAKVLPELPSVELTPAEEAEVQHLVLPVPPSWTGDFDAMRQRRMVRILVPYSRTFFVVNRGREQGISYELGKALEAWLNKTYPNKNKSLQWRVMFIPTPRDQLACGWM